MTKKYYWLKLQEDFFGSMRIKKLRKIAGGDTYTIIYLKMQLKALNTDGILEYKGIEPTFAEELALDLDEDADNVAVTLQFLSAYGMMETSDDATYFLPYVKANTGSETDSARRVRDFRERQQTEAIQAQQSRATTALPPVTNALQERNTDVTDALQCNSVTDSLHCNRLVTSCNTERDMEIEKEKELEIELDKELDIERNYYTNSKPKYGSNGRTRSNSVYVHPSTGSDSTEDAFAKFWNAYPKKRDKPHARKAFEKAMKAGADIAVLLAAIERQKAMHEWKKSNGQYIPLPATWLNGKRWEDVLEVPGTYSGNKDPCAKYKEVDEWREWQ